MRRIDGPHRVVTKIPVNSIEIPPEYLELCEEWHGGINCMLYAVSSSGGLYLGNRRPAGCETDEQWYLHIWRSFAADVRSTVRMASVSLETRGEYDDYSNLADLEDWVDEQVARLEQSYGLED